MGRKINVLDPADLYDFKLQISEYGNLDAEKVLDVMPGYIFGVMMEYGVYETEVRDWLYNTFYQMHESDKEKFLKKA